MNRFIRLVLPLAVLFGLFWIVFGNTLVEKWRFYRYDPALWATSSPKDRYYMARYIVEHRVLNGLTYTEVIRKLGKADEDRGFALRYNLGPERGFISVDGVVLNIYFGEQGMVREVKIRVT